MTAPLVRAMRLKWKPIGDNAMNLAAEVMGLTYVVRPVYSGGWEWWLSLKTDCGSVTNLDAAQAACQADFDARWLAATEVPELVWSEQSDYSESGDYTIYRHHTDGNGGHVYQVILNCPSGECEIWDAIVPTVFAVKELANAHHRALVLGGSHG